MVCKEDFYGSHFEVLGDLQGWDYGIWHACDPITFAFLKPINDEEFIMISIGPELADNGKPNVINGVMMCTYFRVSDYYDEITQEEFNNFVHNIKKSSKKQ